MVFLLSLILILVFLSGSDTSSNGIYKYLDTIEFVYEIPETNVIGLIVMFHGCSHAATDWWYVSQTCPECIGLPAETLLVDYAIAKGLAVVAVSSVDRTHKCWSEDDFVRVTKVLRHMKSLLQASTNDIDPLPVFLLGASSGGSFAGRYADPNTRFESSDHRPTSVFPIAAICMMIAPPHRLAQKSNSGALSPTLFVHMRRDFHINTAVDRAMRTLANRGTSCAAIALDPIPLTAELLVAYRALTMPQGQAFVSAMKGEGFLDENNLLVEDPRQSNWRQVALAAVPEVVPSQDSLVPDRSRLSEVMNICYSLHEIVAEQRYEIFHWLLQHRQARLIYQQ